MGFKVGDEVIIAIGKRDCQMCNSGYDADRSFRRATIGELGEFPDDVFAVAWGSASTGARVNLICAHGLIPMWKKGDKAKVVNPCCKSCSEKLRANFVPDEVVEVIGIRDGEVSVEYDNDRKSCKTLWPYCICMLRPLDSEPSKSCVCDTQVLWCRGCQCGQIQRERAAKEGTR